MLEARKAEAIAMRKITTNGTQQESPRLRLLPPGRLPPPSPRLRLGQRGKYLLRHGAERSLVLLRLRHGATPLVRHGAEPARHHGAEPFLIHGATGGLMGAAAAGRRQSSAGGLMGTAAAGRRQSSAAGTLVDREQIAMLAGSAKILCCRTRVRMQGCKFRQYGRTSRQLHSAHT